MTRPSGRIPGPSLRAMSQHRTSKRACNHCVPKTASFLIYKPSEWSFGPKADYMVKEEKMRREVAVESTAEAYLDLLAARGIDYFFANGGTDFGPIVEAYAKRLASELPL